MSISSAMNSAASGLRANSRLLDTVSSNVANALTEGYARRTTDLSSLVFNGFGAGGVKVVGTSRAENAFLTGERRAADASLAASGTHVSAYDRIMDVVGMSGDAPDSLMALVDDLESALIAASATPESGVSQSAVVAAAKSLSDKLNAISNENGNIRSDVETQIRTQVDFANKTLHEIDELNRKITLVEVQGGNTNALQDERARAIDELSSIIPVTTVKRDGGKVALYSANGGLLLNHQVYELSFETQVGGVAPGMVPGAPLSRLMQDQGAAAGPVEITNGLFDGGSLGALFEVRDEVVPDYQAEVDAFANDLMQRFRDDMPAGFLDAGGDGLFVDPGAGAGASGRIALNAAVDPEQGGELWRIRDGLGAATEGNRGFTDYLVGMSDTMAANRAPAGFAHQSASAGASAMASGISAYFAGEAERADLNMSYLSSMQATLAQNEIGELGVDSDTEIANLMVLEDAYAANARVISTIDELMRLLLEI